MQELVTVVTRKGQVTIPAEIRKALGIQRGDKVAFQLEDHHVRLSRAGSVVERTAGVFQSRKPALSATELRAAAEQAFADEAVERSTRR